MAWRQCSPPTISVLSSSPPCPRTPTSRWLGAHSHRHRAVNGPPRLRRFAGTFALARRLEGGRVTANAVHPGVFRSGLKGQAPAPMRWMINLMGTSPQRAAEPILQVATDPAFATQNGRFLHKAKEITLPAYALDVPAQERLWQDSLHLAGLAAW